MRGLLTLILLAGCCGGECRAQIVRLSVSDDTGEIGRATAVCIGQCDGGSVFLTARHNFRKANRAAVQIAGEWVQVRSVNRSRSHDVASFEASTQCRSYQLAESVQTGARVRIGGYGPEYWGSGHAGGFDGTLTGQDIAGDDGLHPIEGDSGGPVIADGRVVGIVCGYVPTVARTDDSERRYPIVYADLSAITQCLHQVYRRCPPGGCQIYLRPEIRQPMVGIGLPIGPPHVIGVATPVPRPLRPVPDPISIQGPQGERGPTGPAGIPGPQGPAGRSVSRDEIESIVTAWLESNRDSLRGADGRDGDHGIDGAPGPQGERGAAGPAGTTGTTEATPIRLILTSDGKVIDDETYAPGEPLVIDVKRLRTQQ